MSLRRLAPVAFAAALAGCGSFGAIGLGPMERAKPVQSDTLPPVASTPVEKSSLPPPPGASTTAAPMTSNSMPPPANGQAGVGQAGMGQAGMPPPDTNTAMSAPPPSAPSKASGGELGRTDLLGGWTLSSGGENCQLFMTLTSWTGGYRASTRGCQSPVLKSISAWSLAGSQVVLSGANGSPVAHLSSGGGNRFNGQLDGRAAPVSFYR